MQIDVEAIPQMNLANYCRITTLILAAEPRDGGNSCRENKAVACKVAKSLKMELSCRVPASYELKNKDVIHENIMSIFETLQIL